MTWLLTPEAAQKMRDARLLARDYHPTLEERARFEVALRERYLANDRAGRPRIMTVAGDVAEISVAGILTEEPDCLVMLFGGGNTTYRDIQSAIRAAEQDPAISRVVLKVNSPGGEVSGLFETLAVIESATKDISVEASFAASAAYAIAAMAGPIKAKTPASEFGSIGVAASIFVDDAVVDLASTEAPKKRPNVTTEEGKAVVVERLDALHDLFVDAIARGRSATTGKKITVDQVNEEFGRGSVLTAAQAKNQGMIDSVAKQPRRGRARAAASAEEQATPEADHPPETQEQPAPDAPQTTASDDGATESPIMNIEQLKANHPDLYNAVLKEGEAKERKRVLAHLKLAKSFNAMDVAEKAISDGSSTMDEEVHAAYLSTSANRRDQSNRQADSDTAGRALGAAPQTSASADPNAPAANQDPAAPQGDLGDQVVARLEQRRGPKVATK